MIEEGSADPIRLVRDPPTPVYVREVDRSGRAWAVEGLLHEWVGLREWGGLTWSARVSTTDPTDTRLVSAGNLRLRR